MSFMEGDNNCKYKFTQEKKDKINKKKIGWHIYILFGIRFSILYVLYKKEFYA